MFGRLMYFYSVFKNSLCVLSVYILMVAGGSFSFCVCGCVGREGQETMTSRGCAKVWVKTVPCGASVYDDVCVLLFDGGGTWRKSA